MSDNFFGTPKSDSGRGQKNYFSFKKDQNTLVLRILPPLGKLAQRGVWSMYLSAEYGYKNSQGHIKPFLSTRQVDRKTKMVIQESEAHLKREKIKTQLDQVKKLGNKDLETKLSQILRTYNIDSKHYMNAVDLNGNVGLLKLQHKAKLALNKAMDDLRAAGVEPLSLDNGRYFVISRSGSNRDTIFSVTAYKQKIKANVNGVERYIEEDLISNVAGDPDLIAKIKSSAFDLENVYPILTPEQEFKIVHGGPAGVDEVFGARNAASSVPSSSVVKAEQAVSQRVDAAPTSQLPNNVYVSDEDEMEYSMEEDESVSSPKTVTQPSQTTVSVEPVFVGKTNVDLTNMTDDQFLQALAAGGLK